MRAGRISPDDRRRARAPCRSTSCELERYHHQCPMPRSRTLCGELRALSVITNSPICKLLGVGLNSTVMAHDLPPASCLPQVLLATEKLLLP